MTVSSRSFYLFIIVCVVIVFYKTYIPIGYQTNLSQVRKILDTSILYNDYTKYNTNPPPPKLSLTYELEEENTAKEDVDRDKEIIEKVTEENAAREVQSNEIDSVNLKKIHQGNNWRNLSIEQIKELSPVGRRLYLHEDIGEVQQRTFLINIWKFGPSIERRFMKSYGKELKDPFAKCSVNNCKISYLDEDFDKADAVLFHLHRIPGPPKDIIRNNTHQMWVWLTDESPHHTFYSAKDKNFSHYDGYFNWSMNFRMDADVPVPYGRTIPLPLEQQGIVDYKNIFDKKNGTIAAMASNCGGTNKRFEYVKKHLMKFIPVDFYGGCGTLKCPGHFMKDCAIIENYKFYLAFENGNCKHYVSEKPFWNALGKEVIPVVMGPPREQYNQILPPNSFIHVDDFECPEDLAKYITFLSENKEEFSKFHVWRSKYYIANESGYFGSDNFHYCRLCEALNYNPHETKIYTDLYHHWNKIDHCYPPTWVDRIQNCPEPNSS